MARKYISSIFIFPISCHSGRWPWCGRTFFNSNAVTGTSNGLLAALFGIQMPMWWCKGLFPSMVVLGLH